MKVVLIQIPHYYGNIGRPPSFFPLGLGYIAKTLQKAGHDIEIFDIWAHQYTNNQVKEKILDLNYDIVGISALSTQYAYVKWLVAELKKHNNAPIIVGNALATHSPEIVLKYTKTDICCIGEGEITFKEVIENINELEKVKGIYFKKGKKIIKNSPREDIENLDTIDFPAWDLFNMNIYLKNCRVFGNFVHAMNIVTTRGCPYNCKFCSKTFRNVRLRSAENIIEEIKLLKNKFGIKGIFFNDELLLVNRKRLFEICNMIEHMKLKWCCQGRANLVDIEILRRIKKAGCLAIGYGIESGSQKILNNMNKQLRVESSEKALNDTVNAGMVPIIQMMFGYPGETKETIKETINFFKKVPYLNPNGLRQATNFSPFTPLPGSEIYDDVVKKGIIKNEEEYLFLLEAGYMADDKHISINLSELDNKDYYMIMRKTEKKIINNHLRRYFYRFVVDYFVIGYKRLKATIKVYGYKETVRKIVSLIQR